MKRAVVCVLTLSALMFSAVGCKNAPKSQETAEIKASETVEPQTEADTSRDMASERPVFPLVIKNNPRLADHIFLLIIAAEGEGLEVAEGICCAHGASGCSGVSLGDGVCRAGRGSGCLSL